MSFIDNNNIRLSMKSLDYLWEKQRIASENIANNDTPGYKAKILKFEDELDKKLDIFRIAKMPNRKKIQKAIEESNMRVETSKAESTRMDGNNVNSDVEQIELARAQLQYQFQIAQINDQFARLRTVLGKR